MSILKFSRWCIESLATIHSEYIANTRYIRVLLHLARGLSVNNNNNNNITRVRPRHIMDTCDVAPIFVKSTDLPELDERHLALLLCEEMASMVSGDICGAQLIKGIWSIWIKTHEARATLIDQVKVITIRRHRIQLHNDYPIVSKHVPGEKVLFKDLPFDVSDRDIIDYVYSSSDVQIKTKSVLRARIRDISGDLTPFYSGDRFIYIRGGCRRVLPSFADIGSHRCRIFHSSQKQACRRCLNVGHGMHDHDKCMAYYEHENMITIRSPNNVLCNYYSCPVKIYNCTFQSSEHAYQWRFCTYIHREDLAEEILGAPSPAKAKEIASRVPNHLRGNWGDHKLDAMRDILAAKVQSCPDFRQALIDSGTKNLVEAVKSDRFWSCGLNPSEAATTKRLYHPGQNQLGRLLEAIRTEIKKNINNELPSSPQILTGIIASVSSDAPNPDMGMDLRSTTTHTTPHYTTTPTVELAATEPESCDTTTQEATHFTDPGRVTTTPLPVKVADECQPELNTMDPDDEFVTDTEATKATGDQPDIDTHKKKEKKMMKRRVPTCTAQKGRKFVSSTRSNCSKNNNNSLMHSWVKRKLSPGKDADTTNTVKLSRDDRVSS